MIKKKQLEELGKTLFYLSRFPKYIHHQKIDYKDDSAELEWKPEEKDWELSLRVITTDNGEEMWKLSYDLYGWEGVEQSLPCTLETYYEGGGVVRDYLEDCILGMKKWLESEGLL